MSNSKRTRLGDIITKAAIVKCGNDNYPVLSMTMHDGIMLQSERFKKSLASTDTSEYKVVKTGQLVVGFPIDEGVLYIQHYDFDGIMSPAYDIWNVDYSKINDYYLEYALHSPQSMQYYASRLRGTTARRRSIPKEDLLNLSFPLPPLETQRQIAATLDQVTHTIELCNALLGKLDLLVKARFVEMFGTIQSNEFGFTISSLDSVAEEFFAGGDKPKDCASEMDNAHQYPVYANGYENKGLQGFAKNYRVSKAAVTVSARGTIGYCFIREACFTPVVRLITIVPNDKVSVIYLKYAIDMMDINGSGTSQAQLTVPDFKKEKIIIPPLDLQHQFAAFVEQTDKSKLAVQQVLEKAETLKKALMQEYFG